MFVKGKPVFEIKSLNGKGEIEGYGSTFGGEPDAYGDIIVEGAYTETLANHKAAGTMPKMLWQHDTKNPIGKWLEASEDEYGLLLKGKLNMEVQRGHEAHALLKAGDIDGLSIGYNIIEYRRVEDEDIWYLEKLGLREVSIVTEPANDLATVSAVKTIRDNRETLDKLKAGDRLTEREFETLLKGNLGLSNSQAERAVRVHLKGPGDPAKAENETRAFLRALR